MPGQPQLFPNQEPPQPPELQLRAMSRGPLPTPPSGDPDDTNSRMTSRTTPVWLQRVSLFVLVLFCVYLGVLVMVLPWWTRIWDHNLFMNAHPRLAAILHNGAVRGIISGIGLIDIWIGISEAVHYRDYRD
ncbi:hypothetical protein BH10ACI4_BH10ACI4_01710 [soil metagenome]